LKKLTTNNYLMKYLSVLLSTLLLSASMNAQTLNDLKSGTWGGVLTYQNQETEFYLDFRYDENNTLIAYSYMPVIPFPERSLGTVNVDSSHFTAGPIQFTIESGMKELSGSFPNSPRDLRFELVPISAIPEANQPVNSQSTATPAWTFQTAGPIWGDAAADNENIYIGSLDRYLYALSQSSGDLKWKFLTGGAIFSRPLVHDDHIFILSDDGTLYKLRKENGSLMWTFDTGGQEWQRKLPNDETPGYDSMASAATISKGIVYIGSADGHLIAIEEKSGVEKWRFKTNGPIHSIPVVAEGLVFFGSYDHHLYALDAVSGMLKWKFDTGQIIVSSPVYENGKIMIGSRSADLFALNATTGKEIWRYFHWGSWIESSGSIYDGHLYIGSSDDQLLKSFNVENGELLWAADLGGSPWTKPAVTANTVYSGTFGNANYGIDHRGGFFAVDRLTGHEKWRFMWEKTEETDIYGVVSSPIVVNENVFFGGLDGVVYGFNMIQKYRHQ
jgi:eukaryotic-like serine/threonine-protein kinase